MMIAYLREFWRHRDLTMSFTTRDLNVHIRDQHIQRYHDHKKRAAVMVVEGPTVASREASGHVSYPHEWDLR
jgi:hypothetical protein